MDLETVIQSEVSQKEKNKYHILTHVCGTQKMVQMNRFAEQKLRYRCREQTYGHQGGKVEGGGGGGVLNWEIGIDVFTLMCIKWMRLDLFFLLAGSRLMVCFGVSVNLL